MADGGPTAPPLAPIVPPVPTVQLVVYPALPAQPVVPPAQPGPLPQLNWSHFKQEFAGQLDEQGEALLLRTNDWMDIHIFQEEH